jgi:tRNA (guanosine-2'-O-)-methyltransferase
VRLAPAAVVVAIAVACGGAEVRPAAGPPVSAPRAPEGVVLVAACTPTGPELCFDAVDDNCNGAIDEGCGLSTGLLQFVVAWGDSPADVNLSVTAPPVGNGRAAQLRVERDCPREGCGGQNVENASLDVADPPRGAYTVTVELTSTRGASLPLRVRFGASVASRSYGADLEFAAQGDKKTFVFAL